MTRRDFLATAAAASASPRLVAQETVQLRIAPVTFDLGPKHSVRTVAYNGQVPGPIFRWKKGQTVEVEVANDTAEPELLHWHGFHIPSEVDGAMEEGTPMIGARATRR